MFLSKLFKKEEKIEEPCIVEEPIVVTKPLPVSVDILVVADTHGCVSATAFQEYLSECGNIDVCLFLGDHTDADVGKIVTSLKDDIPRIGVLGNHDYQQDIGGEQITCLSKFKIQNLNGQPFVWNDIVFLGLEGSVRYKNKDYPSFTQEESLAFCSTFSDSHIFVTHDAPFCATENLSHQGLQGITEYVQTHHPAYHLHGHLHEDYRRNRNGTTEICTYMYRKYHLE